MAKVITYFSKIHTLAILIALGVILFALLQIPSITKFSNSKLTLETAHVTAGQIEPYVNSVLKKTFFGDEMPMGDIEAIVKSKMDFIASRGAFPASLKVIQKHEQTIRATARKYGVPEEVAIGVGLLENGGSETARSPAGAVGVFQLMPGTARSLGLKVNKSIDERKIPAKNIDAGMRYLALNYYRFGDWGLATWAYHAGEGNVAKSVQIYARANHKLNLPGVKDPQAIRNYVERYGLTIHKLLADSEVKKFTRRLNDDSAGYPFKVVATAELFHQAGS